MWLILIGCLLLIGYIIYEISNVKRKVIRLTQENAILWQVIKEKDNQ